MKPLNTEFRAEFAHILQSRFAENGNNGCYYLKGVFVEPAEDRPGVYLIATDGSRMGVFYDKGGEASRAALLSFDKTPLAAMKPARTDTRPRLVRVENEWTEILKGDGDSLITDIAVSTQEIDGTFPDWRRVLPSPKQGKIQPSFNAKYLNDFSFGTGHKLLTIVQDSDGGPSMIRNSLYPEFLGVIMPVRVDGWQSSLELPEWLHPESKA